MGASRNEEVISRYSNADHGQRNRIFAEFKQRQAAGNPYTRFENVSNAEDNYLQQLEYAQASAKGKAEAQGISPEARQRYLNVAAACGAAATAYSAASTHAQRQVIAGRTSSYLAGEEVSGGLDMNMPSMQPEPVGEKETEIMKGLNEGQRAYIETLPTGRERCQAVYQHYLADNNTLVCNDREMTTLINAFENPDVQYEQTLYYKTKYLAAPTHEARTAVEEEYASYIATCDSSERPGVWDAGTVVNYTDTSQPASGAKVDAKPVSREEQSHTQGSTATPAGTNASPSDRSGDYINKEELKNKAAEMAERIRARHETERTAAKDVNTPKQGFSNRNKPNQGKEE